MKSQNPKFVIRVALALCMFAGGTAVPAQSSPTNEFPQLLPPYGELPPTFWEQHGATLIIAGIGLILLIILGVWLRSIPKPVAIVPLEARARQALSTLAGRTEDGTLLSEVSQILRRYITAAFDLPKGEATTSEFRRLIGANEKIGEKLSSAVTDFLRTCDERKFSPSASSSPLNAVSRALELVQLCESRRAELAELSSVEAQNSNHGRK